MAIKQRSSTRPIVFLVFWILGGANTKLLAQCPQQEQAKFTLIGLLNIVAASAFGWLCWYATFRGGLYIGIHSGPLSIIVFFLTLLLLQAGCRILRPDTGKTIRPSAIKLPSAIIFYLMLIFPIAVWLFYTVSYLVEKGITSIEYIVLYSLFVWVLLIPGVIVLLWASPVYDSLVANQRFDKKKERSPEYNEKRPSDHVEISPEDIRLETQLQELFDLDPKNINIARKLIKLHRQMNKFEEALRIYDTMISHDPTNAELIKEKAQLYQEMGDQRRYAKTIVLADRVLAQASFEENLGKKIILNKVEFQDLEFFGNFTWEFDSQVNVLLGKNGYGKSHLLRALVAMLQAEEAIAETFFYNPGKNPLIQVEIEIDGTIKSTLRKGMLFEESFGKVPVLAIPDMRYIDKSGETVGAPRDEVVDLRSQSAWHFMNGVSYEGLILQFMYDLCLDYLEQKSWDLPIFRLIEKTVKELADTTFTFHEIVRQDSARFTIQVLTDGNESHPLPIQKASQGTLSVLAMVGLTYKFLKKIYGNLSETDLRQQRAIVVIDEIGAHLHPSWQQKIMQIFRDTFPNIQFIVTAHSPLVVAGCKKGEVSVLRKNSKGFIVEVVDDHFIGATSEDIYRRIFDVEENDPTYLRLNTIIGQKSEIKSEIAKYSDRDNLNAEQRESLRTLQDKLYYLREVDEVRKKRKEDQQLTSEFEMLKQESMQLHGQIAELKNQIADYKSQSSPERKQITEKWLLEILHRYPEQTVPVEEFANFLSDQGRTDESIMVLEALNRTQPKNIGVIKTLATQYQALSEYGKASTILKKAVNVEPDDKDLHTMLKRIAQIVEH